MMTHTHTLRQTFDNQDDYAAALRRLRDLGNRTVTATPFVQGAVTTITVTTEVEED